MKIAFYLGKNGTYVDKLVCIGSLSVYSHCEIVMSDGLCLSASKRDGGIRGKYIDLNERWHVYELKGEYDIDAIRWWFEMHRDGTYDWPGAVGSAFGIDLSSEHKKYCSNVCALMIGLDETTVTPGKLFRLLKKSGLIDV